jgi:GT2 family glycosyltransferase
MDTAKARSEFVVGVVIGTFQRPDQLERTLIALSRSSKEPGPVIVVDSSSADFADSTKVVCEQVSKLGLNVTYLHTETKSLTVQKNLGIQRLLELEVDYIQVLDDDTAPRENFLELLSSHLQKNAEVVGVSGVAPVEGLQNHSPLVRLPFVVAGLDSYRPGSVSAAGVGIPVNCKQSGPIRTEWLIGCSMWRASVFEVELYNETLRGSGLFEDVDFSIRARRFGDLSVVCDAVLDHSMSPSFRPDLGLYHYRFSRNRWLVMRSLRAGLFRHGVFLFSMIFMGLYLLFKWATTPFERKIYWNAVKQNLSGYLAGARNTPPK